MRERELSQPLTMPSF